MTVTPGILSLKHLEMIQGCFPLRRVEPVMLAGGFERRLYRKSLQTTPTGYLLGARQCAKPETALFV